MFSRREIFKLLGIFSVAFFLGRGRSMGQVFYKPKRKAEPRKAENLFMEGAKALVGVAAGSHPYQMVKEAVALIGGFERLKLKGKTVLVKPNVVSGEKNPTTTNPDVVGAVVKLLYEHGVKLVYVGDMSALLTLSTLRNMKKSGIYESSVKAGAEVVIFEDYDWVEVALPSARYVKSAYVTEWLYKVDTIINLPVVKTHRSATYSISLKNFIGCTHLKQRPYIVDESHWEEVVSEFNLAYAPDLNIVDGTVSMVEGGPWKGTPADTNLIIASGDRVGADIVGLGIIKSFGRWGPVADKDVWQQRQIKRAVLLGIGRGKEGLKLIGGPGTGEFEELMNKIRGYTGI